MDRQLYKKVMENGGKVSQIIESIVREYYGYKDL